MRSVKWFRSGLVALALCASFALAAPAAADVVLHRDPAKAEAFVANPATGPDGIVLHRVGSRAEPFVAELAPEPDSHGGLGFGAAVIGIGIVAATAAVGLSALAGSARRRAGTRVPA